MIISEIEIKNFKSFNDVSVKLNKFNSIVGDCASGKSNFMEIFKFIRDISPDLKTGISIHNNSFIQNKIQHPHALSYISVILMILPFSVKIMSLK